MVLAIFIHQFEPFYDWRKTKMYYLTGIHIPHVEENLDSPWLNATRFILVSDTVERTLKCPLTMIPTFYDMKLSDHLRLGNSIGWQLHDRSSSRSAYALTWSRAPIAYSAGIQSVISPALKSIFNALVEECFIKADSSAFSALGLPRDGALVAR